MNTVMTNAISGVGSSHHVHLEKPRWTRVLTCLHVSNMLQAPWCRHRLLCWI